jgi:hypothetical protein
MKKCFTIPRGGLVTGYFYREFGQFRAENQGKIYQNEFFPGTF